MGMVRILFMVALFAGAPSIAMAGSPPAPVNAVNTVKGIALKGYDPVAYFATGRPTPGTDEFTEPWKGATYRFASADIW